MDIKAVFDGYLGGLGTSVFAEEKDNLSGCSRSWPCLGNLDHKIVLVSSRLGAQQGFGRV